MANCFNRTQPVSQLQAAGRSFAYEVMQFTKKVEENGSVVSHVRFENVSTKLLAERSDIPRNEEYQLREMVAQGYVPNEVNIKDIFSSRDPLDSSNQADLNEFQKVFDNEQKSFDEVGNVE